MFRQLSTHGECSKRIDVNHDDHPYTHDLLLSGGGKWYRKLLTVVYV